MDASTLATFAMWGDRSNRDTAYLLDIAIAGVIDQTTGHGTVTLRPNRLEEIVSRIAPRSTDPDGGWTVTLLPEDTEGGMTFWKVLRDKARGSVHNGSGFHSIQEDAWRELADALCNRGVDN